MGACEVSENGKWHLAWFGMVGPRRDWWERAWSVPDAHW